jgi:hypothetical protein
MAEIIKIDPLDFSLQLYNNNDENLISTFDIDLTLSTSSSIEFIVYDNGGTLLNYESNYTSYSVLNDGQSPVNGISQFIINPPVDLQDILYNQGEYITYYNFLNKEIGNNNELLYIDEISNDRTEIRLNSNDLDTVSLLEQANNFIQKRNDSDYFLDFYINFGNNDLLIANNLVIDNEFTSNPTILIKLYEPLPSTFLEKSTLWIVTSINEPEAYKVIFPLTVSTFTDFNFLQGPNFNIPIKDQVNNSTPLLNYSNLISSNSTTTLNQLNTLLVSKSIEISVDYKNFDEFVHFSSAQTRIENFVYKVSLIEQYSASISSIQNVTSSLSTITMLENNISQIIENFDNYEYFLYYESGSAETFPKTTAALPYELAKTNSIQFYTWYGSLNELSPYYGGRLLEAYLYDNLNKDQLLKSIPEYLREDVNNHPYELFIDMVAQHFDSIWIYTKDITQKYNADNRLTYGVSKDLVSDAIKDFGVKLYQNNFSVNDLFTAFLGTTASGSLFPFPEITSSLPTPTGYEYVNTLISSSNDVIPLDDVNKSLYKRIYHNIPYLLKSKGTIAGLRALITSYGIPDTILKISEFGGKDKTDLNDYDYYFNKFNYTFTTSGNNNIVTDWNLNASSSISYPHPGTVAFRFKAGDVPITSSQQVLWITSNTTGISSSKALVLEYTGSGLTSGSYSGSIADPYNEYGTLKYISNPNTVNETSCSVYLPFFNEGWWSVMVRQDGTVSPTLGTASLVVGNNIYNGLDGTAIGFVASSSLIDPTISGSWFTGDRSIFTTGFIYNSNLIPAFAGEIQEIRYYNVPLDNSKFYDFVMNPLSIEGNSINSSPEHLVFRAPLGSELDIITTLTGSSIHPKISYTPPVNSFINNSDYYFGRIPLYSINVETNFLDQFPAGLKNRVTDKVRVEDNILPAGDTLSPYRKITQTNENSASYTENVNYLEVAFSPQNEINDDITSQLGYFNVGNYIGDPLERFNQLNNYPNFDKLRDEYFAKYTTFYNVKDFVRLIKFFDNSLFKMIKDFIPARTSLASGIVIKPHLLERNKYSQPSFTSPTNEYYTGSIEEIAIPTAGPAGIFNIYNNLTTSPSGSEGLGPNNMYNVTQSWDETFSTLNGDVVKVYFNQDEFYNGEFSGSALIVTTQSLNQPLPIDLTPYNYKRVHYFGITKSDESDFENAFLSTFTTPKTGEILFYHKSRTQLGSNPTTWGSLTSVIYDTKYLKISKIDCNLNNISTQLGQITKLKIQQQNDSYIEYELTPINEEINYYLFESTLPTQFTYPSIPGQIFDYYVSASFTTPQTGSSFGFSWNTVTGNDAHYGIPYFNTSSGIYTLENTPNTLLQVTASIESSGSNGALVFIAKYAFDLNQNQYIGSPISNIVNIPSGPSQIANMSGSLEYILEGEYVGIVYITADTALNGNIVFNQSRNNPILDAASFPVTSSCKQILLNPNISIPNFFNSDSNPLINNAVEARINPFIQDVDYSSNSITPSNFQAILSENASKGTVPESNYTSLNNITPRYLGNKNSSEKINVWTDNDGINVGNYGKTPSVESKNSLLAYCINGGGLPPEYMDAIQAKIQYVIKDTGDAVSPNTTEASVKDIQNVFKTAEFVTLQYNSPSAQSTEELYRIIRGGYRPVPIMYNQIGHTPATFTSSIEFENILGGTAIVNDYMVKKKPIVNMTYPIDQSITGNNTFSDLNFFEVISSGSSVGPNITTDSLNYYEISSSIIADTNIESLTFSTSTQLAYSSGPQAYWQVAIARIRSGVTTIQAFSTTQSIGSGTKTFTTSITIPKSELIAGDRFQVGRYRAGGSNISFVKLLTNTSTFSISQTPLPTPPIPASPGNPLFFTQASTPNVLIIINQSFLSIYGLPNVKQRDIPGSGFFPIQNNLEFKAGDEIRFEGDETKTYMIQSVISSTFNFLFTLVPALYITLDKPIYNVGIEVNEFLIRRFIEDGSAVTLALDGKSTQGGPFFIIPQFITDTLDTKLETLTEELVNKGLI